MNYRKSLVNPKPRVIFNPDNNEHMRDYAMFIKSSNWKNGCNYYLEDPYADIPTMINEKIVRFTLESYQ